ncbi:hypothetical protein FB561_0287 [Kribbella amoyensis]|uniref:Glyoxalase-like domain-containing protein n=1 Tax=Kribbella amoyensis TaxID=996641 RepID=A0A561BKE4_9ACTN|nr:VOC family protein [Kribbella amoyensis]TWD79232.1 hypothetical protein FB561_0287 [Kribbella amoyensis]
MHKSRVYALLIDTPKDEVGKATSFWEGALGVTSRFDPAYPQFIELPGATNGIVTALQSVDDAPRYHVDIETDDLDAETARLIGLGAEEVSRWQDCRVLRAPGGHLLCVLPVETDPDDFAANANVWG